MTHLMNTTQPPPQIQLIDVGHRPKTAIIALKTNQLESSDPPSLIWVGYKAIQPFNHWTLQPSA